MRFLEDSGIFALPCISVPGGGQISKEVAKWNPTVVAPSFAKDTCASNINLKVGAAQVLKESCELQQETFYGKHHQCSKCRGDPDAGAASAPWITMPLELRGTF